MAVTGNDDFGLGCGGAGQHGIIVRICQDCRRDYRWLDQNRQRSVAQNQFVR